MTQMQRPKTQIAANQLNRIVLPSGGSVYITLIDEWGEPVVDAAIEIKFSNNSVVAGVTDATGCFSAKVAETKTSAMRLRFPKLSQTRLRPQQETADILKQKAGFTYSATAADRVVEIPVLENVRLTFEYNTQTKVWIGLFFDGTGNDNSEKTRKYKGLSNVAVLHDAFVENEFKNQLCHYINGVGTQYSGNQCGIGNVDTWDECIRDSEMVGGGLATGTNFRLDWMMQELETSLAKFPDAKKVNVALFGFSRGATNARIFANRMDVMQPEWQDACSERRIVIKFMGIFDSVCSIGLAGTNMDFGLNTDIPDAVERVVHFMAAHERRRFFDLQSIRTNGSAPLNEKHLEKFYPGVHSDVGGSYPAPGSGNADVEGTSQKRKRNLAAIPLTDMHEEALRSHVPLPMLEEAKNDKKIKFYYDVPVDLQAAYEQYNNEIPASNNLYETLRYHEMLYFWWLAATRNALDKEQDASRRKSLGNLWNFEYDRVKYGRKQTINGKITHRIPPHNDKAVNEYLTWFDQSLQTPDLWQKTDLKKLKVIFNDYLHDSVAAYRYVDGYLQKRGIFFHGDSRWIDEDRI